jgi:succinate-semialdehyde dehydrogenase/glutarate-semialdehyde dehydrogenase
LGSGRNASRNVVLSKRIGKGPLKHLFSFTTQEGKSLFHLFIKGNRPEYKLDLTEVFMLQSKMLINGELVESLSGKTAIIQNPANEEPVAEVFIASRQDALLALEAAQKAFSGWSEISPTKRAEVLHDAAQLVRQRVEEIGRMLTLEQGKPLKDAKREVLASADVFDYYAEEGKRIFGQWITSSNLNSRSLVIKQPMGVAALITPWNFPVDLLAWKIGPAVAAGCTVVAKPPSLAPLAATELVKAVNDAGAPPGVVNVVHGPGNEVGAELVENPSAGR